MALDSLLIANRGEIACRIARTAGEMGIVTTAIYSQDETDSLHARRCDRAEPLEKSGVRAYLDIEKIVALAVRAGCDSVHPGYGFLSENARFAAACAAAGLKFIGPHAQLLELFGDKTRARALAQRLGVPLLPGSTTSISVEEARDFQSALSPGASVILKAVAGGGGRGLRIVAPGDDLADTYRRAQSEAFSAFGNGALYIEEYWPQVRHIEVQIVGDGKDVSHLWERECTLQRRHQKLVEIAPSPSLDPALRQQLLAAALMLARETNYQGLGTFEFLVGQLPHASADRFAFIETNPRLQVEHTVTEEVTGLDLVRIQLQLAAGAALEDLGLQQAAIPRPRGMAMQLRVNAETMGADGSTTPSSGEVRRFDPPGGPGVRVDSHAYAGYRLPAAFDSLLAKLIVRSPEEKYAALVARAYRASCEFGIDGIRTNLPFLQNLLRHPQVLANRMDTRFVDDHAVQLAAGDGAHAKLFMSSREAAGVDGGEVPAADASVLTAPMQGVVVSVEVRAGERVRAGQQVVIIEAMKMEHVVATCSGGVVREVLITAGAVVAQNAALLRLDLTEDDHAQFEASAGPDLDAIRADLGEVLQRHQRTQDLARPDAVSRRHRKGQRTARENIADLCDPGSFVEYGPLVLAAQRARRSVEELIEKSPADGMVTGVGRVNGQWFDNAASGAVVMAYDYTVFAGTQGTRNHQKTDRMIHVAQAGRLPVVLFAEGGGGRPGDTESSGDAGSVPTFGRFAELSGEVPLVGVVSGRCFAGNASLAGCCDVLIATEDANIGMGGPAMVEGGGLGVFEPEAIGPMSVQRHNGVVDILARDEREAVVATKRYLSYFQGTLEHYEAPDQRLLRQCVPENRLRVYDVRSIIQTLSDTGCTLELRRDFAKGMVTSLIRVEGRALGVIANNPMHLGGAIDSDAADKAARFMQLCDAHDIPLLFLCDTPGIMVGPAAEETALVRHSSRMFVIGANLSVPTFAIVLRKAYGLGALAMAGGSFKRPCFTVAWPSGEFGGMGLEGAVKLAYRNELAAIADAAARQSKYEELVARMYEHGKALNISTIFGVDDTIDPAESRTWLATLLRSIRRTPRVGKRWPAIDAW